MKNEKFVCENYKKGRVILSKHLSEDGKYKLELVWETRGKIDPNLLQYPQKKRKINCARKHFEALGIDYRQVTAEMPYWWEKAR